MQSQTNGIIEKYADTNGNQVLYILLFVFVFRMDEADHKYYDTYSILHL